MKVILTFLFSIYSFLAFAEIVAPTAEFSSSATTSCVSNTVTFTDQSTGAPTSWAWTFSPATIIYQNGTIAASQNPQVDFTASGTYNVTLTATNADGSNSITKKNYIVGAVGNSFFEGFTGSVPPTDWAVINPDNLKGWEGVQVTGIGNNPTQVARMDNYQYNAKGQLDELVTPAIDLTGFTDPILVFNVAYAAYSAANSERLHIEYSTDCGTNFSTTTYDKANQVLATGGYQGNGWAPSAPSDWRVETMPLTSYSSGQTIFKFIQTCGYGNGLFIDDVRVVEESSLPVELTEFKGREKDCQVEINWATASERNFSHYELQKKNATQNFVAFAKIEGNNSFETQKYQFIDDAPNAMNYYRLKSIDLDGSFEFSKVISVENSCISNDELSIFPNPSSKGNRIHLEFTTKERNETFFILDNSGKTVKEFNFNLEKGRNIFSLETGDLPVGIYYLKSSNAEGKSFVIQ